MTKNAWWRWHHVLIDCIIWCFAWLLAFINFCCFICLPTLRWHDQDFASRPPSQISHAASSGYGSARSTNRNVSEIVSSQTANTLGPPGRSRNSFVTSLRKPKVADSGLLFRSLRVPRSEPSYAAPSRNTPSVACQSSESTVATVDLPLQIATSNDQDLDPQHEQSSSIPVPAPRFHTLKRHAYQNIPLPLKKPQTQDQPQDSEDPFVQVIGNLSRLFWIQTFISVYS